MTRDEYYKQRSKYRTERSILMRGWDLDSKAHGEVIHELFSHIDSKYNRKVTSSVDRNEHYKISISKYGKCAAWGNSRGTRPVNVKKAGRK